MNRTVIGVQVAASDARHTDGDVAVAVDLIKGVSTSTLGTRVALGCERQGIAEKHCLPNLNITLSLKINYQVRL